VPTVFNWARGRVFDHLMALVLFEMVVDAQTATVTQVQQR
jgi:hypothetical protein